MKRMRQFLSLAAAVGILGLCSGCSSDPQAEISKLQKPESILSSLQDGSFYASVEASDTDQSTNTLVEEAQKEGSLVVYGSCEEPYLAAACERFEELYGIDVQYQRLSSGDVEDLIVSEAGTPSADVWFGGTTDPYNLLAEQGLLMPYEASHAVHLTNDAYRDEDGYWYGIYKGVLGFLVNTEELEKRGVETPQDWDDLLDPAYQGLIWMSNYETSGTAKLILNTMIQKYGYEEGLDYLTALDQNVFLYTKSGSGPAKNVGTGACPIGIGFLHDGITQIVDNAYDSISLVIPASGTSYEIGATAIFEGCQHPNAAKLWIEFALSADCVELAAENGSYQFVVIDNAAQPSQAYEFGIDPENVMDYDFADAKEHTNLYIEAIFEKLGEAADERFQTS